MRSWLAALLLGWSVLAGAETWHFGLIGDVPYSNHERAELPLMLSVIADSQVDFIAHIGDFKHGAARCDDSVFEDRYRLFNNSRVPFIFVPGDNEWSDCDRLSNGAYDPLERLAKLRHLFWADDFSLGMQKLGLERQPGNYVEHSRFRLGPVLFVTLNLPGGNNNYGMADRPSAEFQARNPAVLAWLADSFAVARRDQLAGIVLLLQANPSFRHFSQGLAHRGYRAFLENLQRETMNFSGQVVVVHGDSHMSRIDHPLRDGQGKVLTNFTRVETFGYPLMGWTRGTIDTDSPGLFHFATHPWPRSGY
ncbi:MAG TPA: metallophosphoesterase [Azonexus sp.]|nr:metallophosphoesterase [Azonexus sp.]